MFLAMPTTETQGALDQSLARAKALITEGDTISKQADTLLSEAQQKWRGAAETLAYIQTDFRLSQVEIARRLDIPSTRVERLLDWRRKGYVEATPWRREGKDQSAYRAHAKRVLRDADEAANVVKSLTPVEQATLVAAMDPEALSQAMRNNSAAAQVVQAVSTATTMERLQGTHDLDTIEREHHGQQAVGEGLDYEQDVESRDIVTPIFKAAAQTALARRRWEAGGVLDQMDSEDIANTLQNLDALSEDIETIKAGLARTFQ